MKVESLRDLYVEQLKDLYNAEQQLIEASTDSSQETVIWDLAVPGYLKLVYLEISPLDPRNPQP
jgi:hypothetical protein